MVGEVCIDKCRLLWNGVFRESKIRTMTEPAVHASEIFEVRWWDVLQYEFLVPGTSRDSLAGWTRVGSLQIHVRCETDAVRGIGLVLQNLLDQVMATGLANDCGT